MAMVARQLRSGILWKAKSVPDVTEKHLRHALHFQRGGPLALRQSHTIAHSQCGHTGLDRTLADATVKRMRDLLLLFKRKGVTRLVRHYLANATTPDQSRFGPIWGRGVC